MDKKLIENFENLPFCNKDFEKFFKKDCGIASSIRNVFDSVRDENLKNHDHNFSVFVGEDTVQAISVDGGIDFFTRFDEKGVAQFCYATMVDNFSPYYNLKAINFAVKQGLGHSVNVLYSTQQSLNGKDFTTCGMEVITSDTHSFIENSIMKDENGNVFMARSEVGRFEGGKSYSEIREVSGEDAASISAEKNDLLGFAGQLAKLTEVKYAIQGIQVSNGIEKCEYLEHEDAVSNAFQDICAQNFEQ